MTTRTDPASISAASGYVLPSRPPAAAEGSGVSDRGGLLALRRGREVARAIGSRMVALAECQHEFLAELRERLAGMDQAIADDTRARLKGRLREVLEVLDWCDVVQADMHLEGGRAAQGTEPIDVVELCRDVVANVHAAADTVVTGWLPTPWWGPAADLAEVIALGLTLVAQRTGGHGSRCLEVDGDASRVRIRIVGSAPSSAEVDRAHARHFRQACQRIGIRVVPDELGPLGAGLVLELPAAEA